MEQLIGWIVIHAMETGVVGLGLMGGSVLAALLIVGPSQLERRKHR